MTTVDTSNGLINSLSSINFTPDEFDEILRCKTGTNNFELLSYEFIPVNQKLGFLGDYFKLKVNYKDRNYRTVHCFLKFIATANTLVKNVSQICFKKEEFVYRVYIPLLKNLGFKEQTDFAPECYLIRPDYVIVLEDLSKNGYTCSTLAEPVSEEWLCVVIKQLAKWHACSLLCEGKLSKQAGKEVRLDDLYNEYLQETNFARDKSYGQCMTFGVHYIYRYFVNKFNISGKLSLKEFTSGIVNIVEKVFNLEKSSVYRNVICHRDMWVSNVLMKKNNTGNPSCILVDYQLIKYCPPAIDVLFLIYMNTNKETRNQCMAKLLKEYHQEVGRILRSYEIDINNMFSLESFLKSCEDLKSTSICQALAYSQILFLPDEVLQELNNDEEKSAMFYRVDRKDVFDEAWKYEPFRVRITELLEELYNICELQYI